MKYLIIPVLMALSAHKVSVPGTWQNEKREEYTVFYQSGDKSNLAEYKSFFDKGINSVNEFFGSGFSKSFDIYVHPSRLSLDSTWQKDWQMPEFKSECWMVASGTHNKLDLISPKLWDTQSCEHKYANVDQTQRLITHELVHVFHGQRNVSPDFSNTEGIDWFVEGLATFASGQLDSSKIKEIKTAISENKIPAGLDKFWSGKLRYGLSGSVVSFIDHQYGRKKVVELLPYNKKSQILEGLKLTEAELIDAWKNYMTNR
jgi:hypothetical protein